METNKKCNDIINIQREKIKQIYRKLDIRVGEDIIDSVLNDKEKCENMMRLYKREELESMNYILRKPEENKYFTKFELELLSKIDLFDSKLVEICKKIYEREILGGNI